MKKIISVLSCGALWLSCSAIRTYADELVPIQLEDAVYQQLLDKTSCDKNNDGIITEEEFRSVESIRLDLNDVKSLEFLKNADSLKALYLTGGNFSDFSFLKDFSKLETLQLGEMPQVTNISFIKDMNLIYCFIDDLENITDEQKFAVARFCEDDMQVGCDQLVGMFPLCMFYSTDDFIIEINDRSKLNIEHYNYKETHDTTAVMYAIEQGNVEYTISYKGEIIHKGTINIKEDDPVQLPENTGIRISQIFHSRHSGTAKTYVICDDKMCSLDNGNLNVVKTGVKALSEGDIYGDGQYPERCETTLFTDGHVEVDGKAVSNAENITFIDIEGCYCASDDGCLYVLKEENGEIAAELVYEEFGNFIEDDTNYFVSDKGELIFISHNNSSKRWSTYPTGIMNYISRQNNYFIDENKVLYEYARFGVNALTTVKIASDVEYVGYKYHSGGKAYSCVYITSDGTAYSMDNQEEVELVSDDMAELSFRDGGVFTDGLYGTAGSFGIRDYHISHDDILYIDFNDVFTSVYDVDKYICSEYIDGDLHNVYFRKTDGTVWYYSFADNRYHAVNGSSASVMGDVNGDGSFNTADIVLMHKYLLSSEKFLAVPQNGDLYNDNVLDVFDLVCMRKLLVYGN